MATIHVLTIRPHRWDRSGRQHGDPAVAPGGANLSVSRGSAPACRDQELRERSHACRGDRPLNDGMTAQMMQARTSDPLDKAQAFQKEISRIVGRHLAVACTDQSKAFALRLLQEIAHRLACSPAPVADIEITEADMRSSYLPRRATLQQPRVRRSDHLLAVNHDDRGCYAINHHRALDSRYKATPRAVMSAARGELIGLGNGADGRRIRRCAISLRRAMKQAHAGAFTMGRWRSVRSRPPPGEPGAGRWTGLLMSFINPP
ncbi:hypothetical protein MCBMB27_02672 [Methylobacterium phyllosphaerae]|uniref:Uncharacterized protein n=1 Tax=Methylobacterium phyllosphaerae TaxID=418223 RepID=A0AAE8HW30_9HYPH|nr:hypothetical protein MCBMB27_02672 [Methylobacterium phyllosphaerae]SFH45225.1 hypothetical protein SAMN05192567_12588 [Methylobacterium phyllosphaerae]